LRLLDRSKGIDTVRGVTVPDAGFVSASFYLSRGYVAVTAPDGAEIFIDGRSYGRAPQKEIGVYEGNHRIVVTVGKARWQEAFDIKPNERLKFTVAFETNEEE
ncbi:MAG TPA: PEGA domain-containing protein, partial [Longimicrobium sp.]|nr:PEGA domain-containing protein [Longimicrobium sp.]